MKKNASVLGIIFMLLGTFSLGSNDILVKGLSFNFPIWEIVFFRALSGFLISIMLVIIFGYIIMAMGDTESFQSVKLSPIILIIGYCVFIPASILVKPKNKA